MIYLSCKIVDATAHDLSGAQEKAYSIMLCLNPTAFNLKLSPKNPISELRSNICLTRECTSSQVKAVGS